MKALLSSDGKAELKQGEEITDGKSEFKREKGRCIAFNFDWKMCQKACYVSLLPLLFGVHYICSVHNVI